eukprot:gnl/TRDRNA2_/TRDRNA2_125875_c1_seq3.p1 gnl/TRDRNA2_/TRDRNA2_125875_c1~~gnl/TRDRNA2_/TRDRNA2_125875_c1_seq3.p1  ORF type:complete len:139 (+),score=25.33 gnl/TRDRNA2_/TRDRNA2_125875_c1_seq3:105-521(+)
MLGSVSVGGHYVLRNSDGTPACGLRVLGSLPFRVVCGAAWAAEGSERRLPELVEAVRQRAGKSGISVLADTRDHHWLRLCSEGAALPLGLWRKSRRLGVAVTGIPVNLEAAEQARLAEAPFLVPWEFLPFHAGKIMFI